MAAKRKTIVKRRKPAAAKPSMSMAPEPSVALARRVKALEDRVDNLVQSISANFGRNMEAE